MILWLTAAADAIAGGYLLNHGSHRERRDKPAVVIVGGTLLVCALTLAEVGGIAARQHQHRPLGPAPRSTGTTAV